MSGAANVKLSQGITTLQTSGFWRPRRGRSHTAEKEKLSATEKAEAAAAKVALTPQKETPSFFKVAQEVSCQSTVKLWNLLIQSLNRVWRHGFGDKWLPKCETFFGALISSLHSRMS